MLDVMMIVLLKMTSVVLEVTGVLLEMTSVLLEMTSVFRDVDNSLCYFRLQAVSSKKPSHIGAFINERNEIEYFEKLPKPNHLCRCKCLPG